MKQPYEMTKEEWQEEREKVRPDNAQSNYTKNTKSEMIGKLERLNFLLFGIGKWIYDKACNGEEWALDCLEYGIYDRHEMIMKKAKEEGLI